MKASFILWAVPVWVSAGCASFKPLPLEELTFTQRAETQEQNGLRVSVVALSNDEARDVYGLPLLDKGAQPVWIEIENDTDDLWWSLPITVDPNYFSPHEVAIKWHSKLSRGRNPRIDEHFASLEFKNPIPPRQTHSGFVLTSVDMGVKSVTVELIGEQGHETFSFLVEVPGLEADYKRVDFENLYSEDELIRVETDEELKAALEAVPARVSNKDGTDFGDPTNFFLIGSPEAIFPALVRRGWNVTETINKGSSFRTTKAFLFGGKYRYSPISSLYVYGRSQDIGLQKIRGSIHERNHLRLWLTPILYQENLVWVGAISRDIGVKFTTKSAFLMTHRIDGDLDEARSYLVQDLLYAPGLERLGFVRGIESATPEKPHYNMGGDPFYTDGYRAVMLMSAERRELDDLESFDWVPASELNW